MEIESGSSSSGNADMTSDQSGKEIRIWMDGAFDMMHFGHMNAFRLGKALGIPLAAFPSGKCTLFEIVSQ